MPLIMFDIDGTLTQSVHADEACFVRALREVFGFENVDTDWAGYPHCTDSGILETLYQRRLGRSPRPDESAALETMLVSLLAQAIVRQPIHPVAGAGAFLARLQSEPGMAVSLASGAWKQSARLKLASAALDCSHLPAAFSDDSPQRQQIMLASLSRAALAHRRASFDSVIYVGDGVWDARACRNLGFPFIGIAQAPARIEMLLAEGAHRVFPDYLDAQSFMAAFHGG